MTPIPWLQITIDLPEPQQAEDVAIAHLAPVLAEAEAGRFITAWFFIRKTPQWRLRYLPAGDATEARAHLLNRLDTLKRNKLIARAVEVVYEPETRAFGGAQAMAVAHRLWHVDSAHVLGYLAATAPDPAARRRRELAVLLASSMLRAAGLDWYEQGDVWARVAHHRTPPNHLDQNAAVALQSALRRLISIDLTSLTNSGAPLATASAWAASFAAAGHDLTHLTATGDLHRGLRDVLAHHVIFAMNRLGLPATTQAVLATNAATMIFGPDPTQPTPPNDDRSAPAIASRPQSGR
ncbi:thiopeptide-type bacteriocin biosynthesis protein [Micromonospora sp. DT4]|uniref:thiopeptide-type bacteriocin biosynthesis protein n=1 Tax=Micromonospora sp. DT4 TaxID=3393438 RepID=UPI003CF9651B